MKLSAQTWTRTLTTSDNDIEVGILEAPDVGASLINVNNVTISGQSDVVIIKLNSSGVITWSRIYYISGGSEVATNFILDRDSNIVVVGSVLLSGFVKGFFLKVDFSSGNVIYSRITRSSHPNATFR